MELTKKEQLEINEFSTKYSTVYKILSLLEKRIDDIDKVLIEHTNNKVRHNYE